VSYRVAEVPGHSACGVATHTSALRLLFSAYFVRRPFTWLGLGGHAWIVRGGTVVEGIVSQEGES